MKTCRRLLSILIVALLCGQVTSLAATQGEENALRSANSYLEYMGFSYEGLIAQLEFDKYTHDEAVYAADHCGADWSENALKSAENYLEYTGFSHDGLIQQLEFDKYTHEEAVYAADHCGADWNENAVKSAESYLEYSGFSYDGLIEQLEFDQYSHDQAVYAADVVFKSDASAPKPADDAQQIVTDVPLDQPVEAPEATDAPNAPVIYQALQKGDRGEEVVKLQRALIALGYLNGMPDGVYGEMTEKAVEAFQKAKGLQVTRVADNPTLQVLYASISIDDSINYTNYAAGGTLVSAESAEDVATTANPVPEETAQPAESTDAAAPISLDSENAEIFTPSKFMEYYERSYAFVDAVLSSKSSYNAADYPDWQNCNLTKSSDDPVTYESKNGDFTLTFDTDDLEHPASYIRIAVTNRSKAVAFAFAYPFVTTLYTYGSSINLNALVEVFQWLDLVKGLDDPQMGLSYEADKFFMAAVRPGNSYSLVITVVDRGTALAEKYVELKKGSKGDDVIALQEKLNAAGYSVGTADGDFGGKTVTAISDFQRDMLLPQTGSLDLATYILLSIGKTAPASAASSQQEGSSSLSHSEITALMEAFKDMGERVDRNGDGKISADELFK